MSVLVDPSAPPAASPRREAPLDGVSTLHWFADATITVDPGTWEPPPMPDGGAAFALVLRDGLLLRETRLLGSPAVQLVWPGDAIDVWSAEAPVLCGERVSWTAATPCTLTVLGAKFLDASRRHPALTMALHRQMLAQHNRAARHAAIAQLKRVEQRLLALFCALGDDHGHVSHAGITIDLDLTHEMIGRLIGARRPTVSLALKLLATEGLLVRAHGAWLLSLEATALGHHTAA